MPRKAAGQDNKQENDIKEISLEDKLSNLETIIGEMENDNISLEKAFDMYQKGMQLVKECHESINEVEGKVLKISEDGSLTPFEVKIED